MEKINNVSFEDWVCANELLFKGLHPQKVFDILGVDKSTWLETDKLWKKFGEDTDDEIALIVKRHEIEKTPMSYSFSHITQAEIEADLEANGGFRYFIEADLPQEGLTLAFLKEQDEDDWIDLIEKNIKSKIDGIETVEEELQILNEQEYLFYSVMCLEMDMSWGFLDYFNSRSKLLIKDIENHLEIIGAKKYLDLIKKAKSIYEKYKELGKDDEELEEKLSKLDDKYYKIDDYGIDEKKSLKNILLKYVKKNIKAFVI